MTRWTIETSTALNDYLDWPGLAQVIKNSCQVTFPKTGQHALKRAMESPR
ncbi:hypothetical protein ACFLYO_06875 [Chloroflexota bacterium]